MIYQNRLWISVSSVPSKTIFCFNNTCSPEYELTPFVCCCQPAALGKSFWKDVALLDEVLQVFCPFHCWSGAVEQPFLGCFHAAFVSSFLRAFGREPFPHSFCYIAPNLSGLPHLSFSKPGPRASMKASSSGRSLSAGHHPGHPSGLLRRGPRGCGRRSAHHAASHPAEHQGDVFRQLSRGIAPGCEIPTVPFLGGSGRRC